METPHVRKRIDDAYNAGVLDTLEVLCHFRDNGEIVNSYAEDHDLRQYFTPAMLAALPLRAERIKRAELDALAEKLRAAGYTVTEPGIAPAHVETADTMRLGGHSVPNDR